MAEEEEKNNMGVPTLKQSIKSNPESYGPNLENQLVRQFEAHLFFELRRSTRTFAIKKEVGAGRSIADLVAFLLPDNPCAIYSSSLSAFESTIISVLRKNGEMEFSEFLQWSGVKSLSDSKLKRLTNSGAIDILDGKIYLKSENPPLRIIAYEAKLKDWRSALDQAQSYYAYADEAYVVLPEGTSFAALNHLSNFEEAGVGLLLVSHLGYIKVVEAKKLTDHDWRREFVYSRALVEKN